MPGSKSQLSGTTAECSVGQMAGAEASRIQHNKTQCGKAWHMRRTVKGAPHDGGAMAVGCRRLMAERGSGCELEACSSQTGVHA